MLPYQAAWVPLGIALAGAAYVVAAALLANRRFSAGEPQSTIPQPDVTILKPVHGTEPGLFEALASALRQHYSGEVQLVCGIQDEHDPAKEVVIQLQREFPDRDIVAVIDPRPHGLNPKLSNVINMMAFARHDVFVLADSDITVPPRWLSSVLASLDEPGVGAVSCFYAGAGGGRWSGLAAMGINYQFLPNALFGTSTGLAHPCFGSTIALRRRTMEEIGSFPAFRDSLADDFEIGRAVRRRGYRLAYPPILVSHRCAERGFRELWTHELRWARTIRIVDPLGHWGSILTHPLAWALFAAALLRFSPAGLACIATVVAARLFLKARMDHIAGSAAGPAWLLPIRDLLSFAVFVASLFGGTVEWNARRLRVGSDGAISEGG
jgi:ceramide glucosyltransferase